MPVGTACRRRRKRLEGTAHPDRNDQFEFINDRVDAFHDRGAPVISVDTKKKELVGTFQTGGRDWQPSKDPVAVQVHDFMDDALGKVIPYGVYDLARNTGWVSVGIDHDTPAFAVVKSVPSISQKRTVMRVVTRRPAGVCLSPLGRPPQARRHRGRDTRAPRRWCRTPAVR